MSVFTINLQDGSLNLAPVFTNATFQLGLDWEDDDGPVDLTGYTLLAQFRRSVDQAPELSLTSEPGGGIEVVALAGQMTLTITPEQSAPLCGLYLWGLSARSPAGDVTVLVTGEAEFLKPPTDIPHA